MALFGIKRIQYCKATQLAFSGQNNPFLGIASEPTNTFTDVVCMINSRATLTIEQAVVNKQIVYTAKLQFVTPADPMLDVDHYAFIATTNEGERILLGANTRPQVAVVTAQGVFGTSGELTAYTTTAEFKADYRPLRLPVTAAEPISGPAYDICCGEIVGQEPTPPTPTTLTVIWQDSDGTELERKTYTEGQPEPSATSTPANKAISELFGQTFSAWSLYSETATTKTYRATYLTGVFDWSSVQPTGEQASDLPGTGPRISTVIGRVGGSGNFSGWLFYAYDNSTIHKSPIYSNVVQEGRNVFYCCPENGDLILCFAFIYNSQTDIIESGLPSGTIESGVRGQWYALGSQGNYKVYGWRTADWLGVCPDYGVIIPMS